MDGFDLCRIRRSGYNECIGNGSTRNDYITKEWADYCESTERGAITELAKRGIYLEEISDYCSNPVDYADRKEKAERLASEKAFERRWETTVYNIDLVRITHPPSIPWLGWNSPELWWDRGEWTPDEKWAESQDVRLTWWFDETDRNIAESAGLRSGITSRGFRVPWEGEELSVKGFELYDIRHKGSMARDGAVSFEGFEYGTPVGKGEGVELFLERKQSSQRLSTDFADIITILSSVADEL